MVSFDPHICYVLHYKTVERFSNDRVGYCLGFHHQHFYISLSGDSLIFLRYYKNTSKIQQGEQSQSIESLLTIFTEISLTHSD